MTSMICYLNRILPIVAYVSAPIIIWVIWCTPRERSVMANSLVRCLILNFVVLLLDVALLRWSPLGQWDMGNARGSVYRLDNFSAMLGAAVLIVTNLAIAVYLGWRIWTTVQRAT